MESRLTVSSFRDLIGLRIVEWEPDRVLVEIPFRQDLLNYAGVVAGPIIAAAVDVAAVFAGCHAAPGEPERKALTLTMSVAFLKGVRSGTVRAEGLKQGGGRKIYTSTVRVFDESGDVVATGQATMKYI